MSEDTSTIFNWFCESLDSLCSHEVLECSTPRENAVATFEAAAAASCSVQDGSLAHDGEVLSASVTFTQRDIRRGETRKFRRYAEARIGDHGISVRETGEATEVTHVRAAATSPDGKHVCRIVVAGDKSEHLEIWDKRGGMITSTATADAHGPSLTDAEGFGALSWAPQGDSVAYIAEPKAPKRLTHFAPASVAPDEDTTRGTQYEWREDWGEGYAGKGVPTAYVLRLGTRGPAIAVVPSPPECSVGQVVWVPDGSGVVYVGFVTTPRRFGFKYCINRRSALFFVPCTRIAPVRPGALADIEWGDPVRLTSDEFMARSPVFAPHGRTLAFLAVAGSATTHNTSSSLCLLDWGTRAVSVAVAPEAAPEDGAFPGLFVHRLTERCWLDDSHIAISTIWGCQTRIVVARVDGTVSRLPGDRGVWTLLDVLRVGARSALLAVFASPAVPPIPVLALWLPSGDIEWYPLLAPAHSRATPLLARVSWRTLTIPVPDAGPGERPCVVEALLLEPPSTMAAPAEGRPLVVMPHGGPHNSSVASHEPTLSLFLLLGYTLLLPNYRGSLGRGLGFVEALVGHVGTRDVADVQACVENVLAGGGIDPSRVSIVGGSHGGFLAGHCSLRHPDIYRACVMRNPVTNIAAMVSTSDIPDWCFAVLGLPQGVMDKSVVARMFEASPMAHIDKAVRPTMLLLGADDKRVPPSQGMEYAHALRARHVPCRVLIYPDNGHAVVKPDCEGDAWVNAAMWLHERLS